MIPDMLVKVRDGPRANGRRYAAIIEGVGRYASRVISTGAPAAHIP
ncbi:hypothetical protein GCM10023085_40300 [Actinomadura viridis]